MRAIGAAALFAMTLGTFAAATTARAEDTVRGKSAGDFMIRARGVAVVPNESGTVKTSSGAETGLRVKIDESYVPELDFSYFITDNIALELIAATTSHSISAQPANLKLGNAWLLPPTLTVQYHPLPKAKFSPYIGAGVNYTFFYNETASHANGIRSVRLTDAPGAAIQAGIDIELTEHLSLNLDVKQIFLNTNAKVSLMSGGYLKSSVDINPLLIGFGIGYRF